MILSLALLPHIVEAQAPGCFTLESFLADACGSPEGLNEMVRFTVGPAPLNTSTLNVNWPNVSNSWQGVCQNATTANLTTQLNASITGCGEIIEPTNGVLPAGATVILFTSAFFNPAANPFTNLNETIYAIYQCGNETGGNFANSGPNPRTITLSFGGSCSQQVTYIPDQLTGGDGATVEVSTSGAISYTNSGCQGLFEIPSPAWTPPGALCSTEAPFDLNDFITGTPGGVWTGTGQTNAIVDPSTLNGTYSFTYTVSPGGCATPISETHNITIIVGGDASWTNPGTVCATAGNINLNALITGTTGGTWSGNGVSGSQFNPAGLTGNQTITYTVGSGNCSASQSQTFAVQAASDASWTPFDICTSAAPLNLNNQITGESGGIWAGQGVNANLFDPAGLLGSIALTYSVGSGACQASSTQNITVSAQADASWTSPLNLCANAPVVDLNNLISGTTGGSWSGQGVTGSNFNPAGLSGAVNITYTVGPPGCDDSEERTIAITLAPDASWSFPAPEICETSTALNLNALLTGAPGGVWSGPGVTAGSFNPAGLNGSVSVDYEISVNGCIANQSNSILVTNLPPIVFAAPTQLCENAGNQNLTTWNTGTQGGTWSGPGVGGNTFNPLGLSGNTTLSYSVSNAGCTNSDNLSITILSVPVPVQLSGVTDYCANETPQTLSAAGTENIQWFSDAALTNLVQTGSSHTPSAAATSQTLYVVQTNGLCSSNPASITVNPIAIPETPITTDTVRWCADESIPTLNAFANNAIVWYAEAECLTVIGQGPQFTPAEGTAIVYLRAENQDCVSEVKAVILEEQAAVTADILGDEVIYACLPKALELVSANPNQNQWSTGSLGASIWVTKPGMYYLVRQGECNIATDSIRVEDASFDVAFSIFNSESFAPVNLPVSNLTSGADECTWYLDGVETELNDDGSLYFANDTIYSVMLECVNSAGCKNTMEQKVVVGHIQLLFPNTFTPNEDGINDLFRPVMYGISSIDLSIFNRWGEEIFRTTTIDGEWDGKVAGREAPDGIYIYSIIARDKNAKIIRERGRIQLMR